MPKWASKKVGPFPVIGWIGIAVAGVGLGFLMKRGFSGSGSATAPTPAPDDSLEFTSDSSFADIQLGQIQERLRELGQEAGTGEVNQASDAARRAQLQQDIQALDARIAGIKGEITRIKALRVGLQAKSVSVKTAANQALFKAEIHRLMNRIRDEQAKLANLQAQRTSKVTQRDAIPEGAAA